MPRSESDFTDPDSSRASRERYPLAATRHSHDSIESLRNLELSDGPMTPGGPHSALSFSGFDFQRDLLPLSASLSEPDGLAEKSIGLLQGIPRLVISGL